MNTLTEHEKLTAELARTEECLDDMKDICDEQNEEIRRLKTQLSINPSIIAAIRHATRPEVTGPEHDETAAAVSAAICALLDEIILVNEEESERLSEWAQAIREQRCKVLDHDWTIDNCGYWGHQYCVGCHAVKYPELGRLSCSDAIAKIGDISEDEYEGLKT